MCKNKNYQDLKIFDSKLPISKLIYSDCNPLYYSFYGSSNIAAKGAKTNIIESLNSQIRQFNSSLRRKTKCYAKSFDLFNNSLAHTFITKIIN